MTFPIMKKIACSKEAKCADERFCFRPNMKNEIKKKWKDEHDLFVSDGRSFALVTNGKQIFFMDSITGTLYQFGKALSSNTLTHDGFVRDKKKSIEILDAVKGSYQEE